MYYSPIGPAKEINRAVGRLTGYARESVERYWKQLQADPGEMLLCRNSNDRLLNSGIDNVKPTMLTKEFAAVENGTIVQVRYRCSLSVYGISTS